MECESCSLRSSVGYCAECRKLLCEVCGVSCRTCGKLVCREHTKTTSSGKELCASCYAERQARKQRHAKEGDRAEKGTPTPRPENRTPAPSHHSPPPGTPISTSFESLGGAEIVTEKIPTPREMRHSSISSEEDAGPVISDEALGASGHRPAALWKKSVKASLISLVAMIIIYQFSGYWWAYLPNRGLGAIIVILIPLAPALFSALWSVMGFLKETYMMERGLCLIGLVIDLVSLVLAMGIYARA